MTSKDNRPTRFIVVVISAITLTLVCASSVVAAHDMCPDYSEYKGVLDEGNASLEKGSYPQGGAADRQDLGGARIRRYYEGLKEPKLQQYIDVACSAENNQEVTNAIRWWTGVATDIKRRNSSSNYQYVLARAESRLADLALIECWADVIDDLSEPPYLEWREAARSRHNSVLAIKESIFRSKKISSPEELTKVLRELDNLEIGSDPSALNSDKTKPLFQGSPPRQSVAELFDDNFWRRQSFVTTELTVPVLAAPLQNRLLKILTEKLSSTSINAKAGPQKRAAIAQAMKLYESAIGRRRQLADGGRSAFCVFDLIKLAMLEHASGNESRRESHLADATKLFTSAHKEHPEHLTDDYNLANLQSSKILYYLITRELVNYGKRNSKTADLQFVESRLESDFPRRWAPTAMKCYADTKDRSSVLRVFEKFGADVLSPDAAGDRAVLERIKVAEALFKVDATQEAAAFISVWIDNLPDDQIGKAIQSEAIGELDLKQGEAAKALVRFENALTILSTIKNVNEYVARSQRDICWKILNRVTSSKSPQIEALRTRAHRVISAANHRLMQLECIALSKHLAETGAKLERMGQYETAGRVYAASADIKLKNLGADNAESVKQQVDTARALMSSGKLAEAEALLNDAIKVMRRSSEFDGADLRAALETRADALSRLNRGAEAELLYVELRAKN